MIGNTLLYIMFGAGIFAIIAFVIAVIIVAKNKYSPIPAMITGLAGLLVMTGLFIFYIANNKVTSFYSEGNREDSYMQKNYDIEQMAKDHEAIIREGNYEDYKLTHEVFIDRDMWFLYIPNNHNETVNTEYDKYIIED